MTNNAICYAEIDAILNMMDDIYVKKIPKQIIDMIKNEKDKNYNPNIDVKKSLGEQNLQKDTLDFLAALSVNYWCENEGEKQELLNAYFNNEQKHEIEKRKKYNPDNIFVKKNKIEELYNKKELKDNTKLVPYRKSFISRIFEKIKSFFGGKKE